MTTALFINDQHLASGLQRNPSLSANQYPLLLGSGASQVALGQGWLRNLAKNRAAESDADARYMGPRGEWWWTGPNPVRAPAECPGLDVAAGVVTALPAPDLTAVTRAQAIAYFQNSWLLTETLFSGLQGLEAFYRPPYHNQRHSLIFYYAHVAVLYINKMRLAGLVKAPVNAALEALFESGVDSMSWDDLSKNDDLWPLVSECTEYRRRAYAVVMNVLETHPALEPPPSAGHANNDNDDDADDEGGGGAVLSDGNSSLAPKKRSPRGSVAITPDSPLWAVFLGIAHEAIHLETSSVLMREAPLPLMRRPDYWPHYHASYRTVPEPRDIEPSPEDSARPVEGTHYEHNAFLPVPQATKLQLGRGASAVRTFGWDNEFGHGSVSVPAFAAQRSLVTNGEFYQFVASGAYLAQAWWTPDGWAWRTFRNAKWPTFWVPRGPQGLHDYALRLIFELVDMPWDAPAVVNYHEANAYKTWLASRTKLPLRLLTEPEFRVIRDAEVVAYAREVLGDQSPAGPELLAKSDPLLHVRDGRDYATLPRAATNLNLAFGAEVPVRALRATAQGFHDPAGNVWHWLADVFLPLPGFEVHRYYEDFSTPCFDRVHAVIAGGSFISTGNLANQFARYHFRPFLFQHAGFRLAYGLSDSGAPVASSEPVPTTEHLLAKSSSSSSPSPSSSSSSSSSSLSSLPPSPMPPSPSPSPALSLSSATDASASAAATASPAAASAPNAPSGEVGGARTYDYESAADLARYLALHFNVPNDGARLVESGVLAPAMARGFSQRIYALMDTLCTQHGVARRSAFDLGCAVGGVCFELAATFADVLGVDLSYGFVQAAQQLAGGARLAYELVDEAELSASFSYALDAAQLATARRCRFETGDACTLRADIGSFDAVLMCNLLCRLPEPAACLRRALGPNGLVARGGLLFVMTPCSWNHSFTEQAHWLGGFRRNGGSGSGDDASVRTLDGVRAVLGGEFELVHSGELPLLIRLHSRKFELITSQLSVWKKLH